MGNEKFNNLAKKEIENVFKASCNVTPDDKYRNLVEYFEKKGIRINEVISGLNNNPEFSIDEFEGYILYSKKEDLIFQLKLRREAMLKKASEVRKSGKEALAKQIEEKQKELKRVSTELEKLKGIQPLRAYSQRKNGINPDFKLRKMYALQEEQKKYWDLNGDYIKSLIDEILIKCGDDNETLDKKIADMVESVYSKKIGETKMQSLLEEKCSGLLEYRKQKKKSRIQELERRKRKLQDEIKVLESENKDAEEDRIISSLKSDLEVIDGYLPEGLRGTPEEREEKQREMQSRNNNEEQDARKESEEMAASGPMWGIYI